MNRVKIEKHPLFEPAVFRTDFSAPLGRLSSEKEFKEKFDSSFSAPLETSDVVRSSVRELLRWGGFKPTGRNKPAAEYLTKAADENRLSSINPAVDFCNIVSLHCGLPISVVDIDRTKGELSVKVAPPETSYVFNPSGQEIRIDGLICLFDEQGPCANAVKDSQRTKTSDETASTLTIIWGTNELNGRTATTLDWYLSLLRDFGAACCECEMEFE